MRMAEFGSRNPPFAFRIPKSLVDDVECRPYSPAEVKNDFKANCRCFRDGRCIGLAGLARRSSKPGKIQSEACYRTDGRRNAKHGGWNRFGLGCTARYETD